VRRLEHIPVGSVEWSSMAAIHALWYQRGLAGRPVLATNRRNDLTYANGAYLPWFLDAPPAAWITTYDPGLADRDSVQRDAVADLCRNRAPVVEENIDPSASSNGEFGFENHRSRYLDEFVALNYQTTAVAGFYRLRQRETGKCVYPDEIALADAPIMGEREHALRDDDIPRAAALSILLVERAANAGAKPRPDDVAGAVLGGYWVPDDQLPSGPTRAALLALRDRTPTPGEAEAVTAARDPIVRLAANTAYLTYRPANASPQELQAVVKALFYMARTRAYWPLNVRNLFGLQPPSAQAFALVQRNAGGGADLERIRFAFLRNGGSPRDAVASGLRLVEFTADHPLDQGQALLDLAAVFEAEHQTGCAERARAYADSIPGVHYAGSENAAAPCPVDIPQPSLKPESG
jgi:hypothetical protein